MGPQSFYMAINTVNVHSSLFLIIRKWRPTRCPSIEEHIKKMWYSYMMEYWSAMKTKDMKWMYLQTIILSEVNHSQKNMHYHAFTYKWNTGCSLFTPHSRGGWTRGRAQARTLEHQGKWNGCRRQMEEGNWMGERIGRGLKGFTVRCEKVQGHHHKDE